jgi:hypothetical protein
MSLNPGAKAMGSKEKIRTMMNGINHADLFLMESAYGFAGC